MSQFQKSEKPANHVQEVAVWWCGNLYVSGVKNFATRRHLLATALDAMLISEVGITPLDRVFHEDAVKLSGSDPKVDNAWNEEAALRNTNALIRSIGITGKTFFTFLDLCMNASSMFVVMFEALFQTRLGGIVRQPQYVCDYVSNAQNVIDALEGLVLEMSLAHIRGEAIVRGDSVAIVDLVDIFMLISRAPVIDGVTAAAQVSASATGLPPAHHEATMPPAPETALPAPMTVPTREAPSPPAPAAEKKRKRSSEGDNADDTTTDDQAAHGHNTRGSAHSPATAASPLLEHVAEKPLAVPKTAAPATSKKLVLPLDQNARELLDASSKASAFTALAGASIDFHGRGGGAPLGLQQSAAAPPFAAYGVGFQQQQPPPPGPASAPASYGFEFKQEDGTARFERIVPPGAPPRGYAPLTPHWAAAAPTGGEPMAPTPAAYADRMAYAAGMAAGMASGMMHAGMPAGLVARPQHPFAPIAAATQPAPSAAALPEPADALAPTATPVWLGQANMAAPSACAPAPPKRGGPAITFTLRTKPSSTPSLWMAGLSGPGMAGLSGPGMADLSGLGRPAVGHHSRIGHQPWLFGCAPASVPATGQELRPPAAAPAAAPASGPVDGHTTSVYYSDEKCTTCSTWCTVLGKHGWRFQGFSVCRKK